MNPKITIITINYNNHEGLEKTIKSVISQSYKDFEYIVIDGGSQDGSREVIEKFADKISYWVSEPDKGIYNAMNKGIKVANGEYLLFLNSGDKLFNNDSLLNILPYLEKEDIVYGNLEFIDINNENFYGKYPETISFHFLFTGSLPHPASFIKKTAFDKVGFYDENLKIVSDWKWFIIAFTRFSLTWKQIPIIVSKFYLDGISSTQVDNVRRERDLVISSFTLSEKKDAETINKLEQKIYELDENKKKLKIIKKSKWLKLGYKLGLFKAYKYL